MRTPNRAFAKMKWDFFCVVKINLVVIVITCGWPFPMYRPTHRGLWEEHYVKISRSPPYPGVSHISALNHRPYSEPEPLNQFLYPPNQYQSDVSAEPEEEEIHYILPQMNLNRKPAVQYSQRELVLRPDNRDNYRYRKKVKNPKPFSSFQAYQRNKQYNYHQQSGDSPPDYNVEDVTRNMNIRYENPNSAVNIETIDKELDYESDAYPQNANIKDETITKDIDATGTQTDDDLPPAPITESPIGITSFAMESPNGGVSNSDAIYDAIENGVSTPASTQLITPVLLPSTESVSTFYLPSNYARIMPTTSQSQSLDAKTMLSPTVAFDSPVTVSFDDVTVSPVTTWTSQRSLVTPPPLRKRLPTEPMAAIRFRKRFTTERPAMTTDKSKAEAKKSNLSGAAIAGIIIGSLVSIALLAGAALFVMYKSPFGRSAVQTINASHHRASISSESIQTEPHMPSSSSQVNASNIARIYRWPPHRHRRPNP